MKAFNSLESGIFLFLSVLLFVGCNNNSNTKAITKDSYIPQTHIVEIKDMQFQPADLTVHKGDTVVWINKDIVAHDVTEKNKTWASPPLLNEASFKKAITESDSYFCSIHVVMLGKLTVEE